MMLLIALFVVANGLPISQLSSMGKTNFVEVEGSVPTLAEYTASVETYIARATACENEHNPDGTNNFVDDYCCQAGYMQVADKWPLIPAGTAWEDVVIPDAIAWIGVEDGDKKVKDGVCCQHGKLGEDGECPPEEMDLTEGQIMGKGVGCPDGLEIKSKDECGLLGSAMGLCDRFVSSRTSSKNYPNGCFYSPLDKSPCPKNGGNKLYWNSRTISTYFTKAGSSGSYRNLCKPNPEVVAVVAANACPDKHQKISTGCCYETNIIWNSDYSDGTCCKGAVIWNSDYTASECPPPGSCGVWLDPQYKAPYYKTTCAKKQNAELCNADDVCEWWFDAPAKNRKPDCDSYWLTEAECLDPATTPADQECYWGGKCQSAVACPLGSKTVGDECCGNDKILWNGNVPKECCAGDTVRTGNVCGTAWVVVTPGTKLEGKAINGGTPLPVTLTLNLGDNVWIVGLVELDYLKMVKIKITGSTTYQWQATRYYKPATGKAACKDQATFTEDCFAATETISQDYDVYPVALHATAAPPPPG